MKRLEQCQLILTKQLDSIFFIDCKSQAFHHLQTVSNLATLLAYKRSLDPCLLAVAGLFHDLSFYLTHVSDQHAKKSAELTKTLLAKEKIFTEKELMIIIQSINLHSNKDTYEDAYAEALKDADVLAKIIDEPNFIPDLTQQERYLRLKKQIGA